MQNHVNIDTKTRLAGLIGHPVGHSLSPFLHGRLCELTGVNMAYLAFDSLPENLPYIIKGGLAMNAVGFNVTVPYKKDIMSYLDSVDPDASLIGAVNTVKYSEDGIVGFNTDMPGLLKALDNEGISLKDGNVVLIGAGGVANAVLCAAVRSEASNIMILNRTGSKARELAERFEKAHGSKITVHQYDEDFLSAMDRIGGGKKWIALQCTSLGMYPEVTRTAIDDDAFFERVSCGVDMIFNPSETEFMKRVKAAGGQTMNGLKMLIFQGIRSFEIWNDVTVSDDDAALLIEKMQGLL